MRKYFKILEDFKAQTKTFDEIIELTEQLEGHLCLDSLVRKQQSFVNEAFGLIINEHLLLTHIALNIFLVLLEDPGAHLVIVIFVIAGDPGS